MTIPKDGEWVETTWRPRSGGQDLTVHSEMNDGWLVVTDGTQSRPITINKSELQESFFRLVIRFHQHVALRDTGFEFCEIGDQQHVLTVISYEQGYNDILWIQLPQIPL